MEQPIALAGIITAILFFLFVIFGLPGSSIDGKKLPPEAGGAWPVIGHLHMLSAREPLHITMTKLADAYGPIFTLRFVTKKALIVSNWDIAKELFTTNDKIFASRPRSTAAKLLGYNYAMMGTIPYNSQWRHTRKIATLELLTNHRLEQLQHIRASEVRSWMKKLYELWIERGAENNREKAEVEMKNLFGDITLNIVSKMVIGKGFSAAFDGNGDGRKLLRDLLELFAVFIPSDYFPFLSWLDLGGHIKAMKETARTLDEVFDKFLKQHRQRPRDHHQDFMDVMISTLEDEQQHFAHDPNTVIKATCLNMILGGFDTTTISMTWVISLLLNNEDALKKVQLELDEHVGRERQVKESDVKNLSYLQAVVKETLRLYPAAPLLGAHESTKDCTTAGYHIPKGTLLLVNVQKLQRDPLVWKDPFEFHPERFITSQKNFDVRGQSPQLIPFGNGRRMCPAVSFALQIMHVTLANFLHGFEISRPSKELLDMEESVGPTSIRKAPLDVVITPRLPSKLYE